MANDESDNNKNIITFIFKEVNRYKHIVNNIIEFCKILNDGRIYILIDEWTSIDKSGRLDIQPIFAEMLNKTFRQIQGVTIIISAIRGTTRLFRKDSVSRIGLELRQDIYEAMDLDTIYANNDENNTFFSNILFNKMIEVDDQMTYFSKTHGDAYSTHHIPKDGFIGSFFEKPGLFTLIIEASGRIPRIFLELFINIALQLGYNKNSPWKRQPIVDEIVMRSLKEDQDIFQQEILKEFYKKACDIARQTNQRIFFAKRDDLSYLHEYISDLFHFKKIHNVSQHIIPNELNIKFRLYTLDYGTYLHLTGRDKLDGHVPRKLNLLDADYINNCSKYTIELDDVLKNCNILCLSCDRILYSEHECVKNLNACYYCYQPLDKPK